MTVTDLHPDVAVRDDSASPADARVWHLFRREDFREALDGSGLCTAACGATILLTSTTADRPSVSSAVTGRAHCADCQEAVR